MPRPTTHRKSDGRRPFLTISLAPELNSQLRAEADKAGLAVSWIIEDRGRRPLVVSGSGSSVLDHPMRPLTRRPGFRQHR
jgi:hypothetical protein